MIDEYQGIKLLAKLALDKNKENIKQSTIAYHAGRHMLWDFIKSEHPMAPVFQNKSFLEVMQYLYPEYSQEAFDAFKIVPVDDDEIEEYAEQLKAEVDSETTEALEYGIWLGYL